MRYIGHQNVLKHQWKPVQCLRTSQASTNEWSQCTVFQLLNTFFLSETTKRVFHYTCLNVITYIVLCRTKTYRVRGCSDLGTPVTIKDINVQVVHCMTDHVPSKSYFETTSINFTFILVLWT